MPDGGDRPVSALLVLAASEGGIARHVRDLATGLRAAGAHVAIAAPARTIDDLGLADIGVRLVPAPVGVPTVDAALTTRRILGGEAGAIDVVHAHGLRAGAVVAAAGWFGPLVVTWHNAALGGTLHRASHAALRRYVARRSDLTLAASDDLALAAAAAGARRIGATFVPAPPLAPLTRTRAEIRAELGAGAHPLVLAIGRLHHQKRFDVLVEAATRWGSESRTPRVVIAGDGPARAQLAALIEVRSAPVTLLGARTDVADLLLACDVVALPSEWEAQALVAQEALKAGVPLVATEVGGVAQLVGDAALLVAPAHPTQLRRALEKVLDDPELRERMITTGRERASTWPTSEQVAAELMATYRELLAAPGLRR
ncbi:MAG TPA: glycosyltransferase family 4 protein [Mycobacteriales bacterium]|nr:glycosyltransferase family 4 protein [Mycobacteriales bacterium]